MIFKDEKMQKLVENDIIRIIETFNTILDILQIDSKDEYKLNYIKNEINTYLNNRTNFKDYRIPTFKLNEEKSKLIPITSLDEVINIAKMHMFNQNITCEKLNKFYEKLQTKKM